MNTIVQKINLSPEHVQIRRLTRIVLISSSLAAIPGCIGSSYLLYVLFVATSHERMNVLPFCVPAVLGWYLYLSYWLELLGRNRYGMFSWMLSTFFNSVASVFVIIFITNAGTFQQAFLGVLWLGYLLSIIFISLKIWKLKVTS